MREGRCDRVVVSAGPLDPDSLGSSPSSATYSVSWASSMTSLGCSFLICDRGRSPPHRLNELNIRKALGMPIASTEVGDLMLIKKGG